MNSWNKYSQHTTNFAVISQITRQCKYDQQRHTTCLIKNRICLLDLRETPNCEFEAIRQHVRNMKPYMLTAQYNDDNSNDDSIRALCEQKGNKGGYFSLNLPQLSKGTGFDLGRQFGIAPICLDSSDRLLKLKRISIFTLILRNELRKLQWNPPSHDSSGLVRRGETVLSSPRGPRRQLEIWQKWTAREPNESIRSYRRNCARHSKPKLQLTWRVTRIKCCESIFLKLPDVTEKKYFLLIWKILRTETRGSRGRRGRRNRGQHELCQSGKSGSSSDNIVTWDIRSHRSWLVPNDIQQQGEKLYGLFSKSCVVQRAKHDLYRCHPVQECYHAVYFLTSALALIWLTWMSEMEPPLKH